MQFLIFKTLLKKKGLAESVLAISFLVAILISAEAITNYINSEVEAIGNLSTIGDKYLILSKNSTYITDSKNNVISKLFNSSDIKYMIPQILTTATISTVSGNISVQIRSVDDVNSFLQLRGAHVNDGKAKNVTEANIGVILANSASINQGDEVRIIEGNEVFSVIIVGVFTTHTELDTEMIIPITTQEQLHDQTWSFIEFSLKPGIDREEAINHITEILPENMRIVKVQQPKEFVTKLYDQTLNYLNLWSIAIYVTIIGASYTVSNRLIKEANYELSILRALGTKKRTLFSLIMTYTLATTLLGCILGVSLGIAGTKTASTTFLWIKGIEITPNLEILQATQTLLLTLASSIIGCLYPAYISAKQVYTEKLI